MAYDENMAEQMRSDLGALSGLSEMKTFGWQSRVKASATVKTAPVLPQTNGPRDCFRIVSAVRAMRTMFGLRVISSVFVATHPPERKGYSCDQRHKSDEVCTHGLASSFSTFRRLNHILVSLRNTRTSTETAAMTNRMIIRVPMQETRVVIPVNSRGSW